MAWAGGERVSGWREARSHEGRSILVPRGYPKWRILLRIKCTHTLLIRRARRFGFQGRFLIQAPAEVVKLEFWGAFGNSVEPVIPELVSSKPSIPLMGQDENSGGGPYSSQDEAQG